MAVGARPWLLKDWRFWTIVAGVNLLLMAPLAAYYIYSTRRQRKSGEPPAAAAV